MKDFSEKPNRFLAKGSQIRLLSLSAQRFVRLLPSLACSFSDLLLF
jgi:hypothetical protein